jgi:septal ring factor EnvC (AmiA/AmiB activator)
MRQRFQKTFITLLVAVFPFAVFAQNGTIESAYDTLTIESQFDYLFKRSNRYEEYKVMRMSSYEALKQNSLDSIKVYSDQISKLNQEIGHLNTKIESQASEIEKVTTELDETRLKQDSMNFLGLLVSKEAYNGIMWGIVVCLLILAGVLFSLFKKGHAVVKATKERLEEVQSDLENHRKNALIREQKLARELMDIKLRHRSSK